MKNEETVLSSLKLPDLAEVITQERSVINVHNREPYLTKPFILGMELTDVDGETVRAFRPMGKYFGKRWDEFNSCIRYAVNPFTDHGSNACEAVRRAFILAVLMREQCDRDIKQKTIPIVRGPIIILPANIGFTNGLTDSVRVGSCALNLWHPPSFLELQRVDEYHPYRYDRINSFYRMGMELRPVGSPNVKHRRDRIAQAEFKL